MINVLFVVVLQEGKSKAQEIRSNLKNLEASSGRLSAHYTKAQNDINETFQVGARVLGQTPTNSCSTPEQKAITNTKQLVFRTLN